MSQEDQRCRMVVNRHPLQEIPSGLTAANPNKLGGKMAQSGEGLLDLCPDKWWWPPPPGTARPLQPTAPGCARPAPPSLWSRPGPGLGVQWVHLDRGLAWPAQQHVVQYRHLPLVPKTAPDDRLQFDVVFRDPPRTEGREVVAADGQPAPSLEVEPDGRRRPAVDQPDRPEATHVFRFPRAGHVPHRPRPEAR